jgi:hypothetical protein
MSQGERLGGALAIIISAKILTTDPRTGYDRANIII